jgi:hypothetical protein
MLLFHGCGLLKVGIYLFTFILELELWTNMRIQMLICSRLSD